MFHIALGIQIHHVTQICIFLTTCLQQQQAQRHSQAHFNAKEALCQVSEKCILFHTRTHIFPWKLEISRAVAQYSTTEAVSSKEDLGFQDQTTEIKTPQQRYFTIKTPYIQCDKIQFYKCLQFRQVIYLYMYTLFYK